MPPGAPGGPGRPAPPAPLEPLLQPDFCLKKPRPGSLPGPKPLAAAAGDSAPALAWLRRPESALGREPAPAAGAEAGVLGGPSSGGRRPAADSRGAERPQGRTWTGTAVASHPRVSTSLPWRSPGRAGGRGQLTRSQCSLSRRVSPRPSLSLGPLSIESRLEKAQRCFPTMLQLCLRRFHPQI